MPRTFCRNLFIAVLLGGLFGSSLYAESSKSATGSSEESRSSVVSEGYSQEAETVATNAENLKKLAVEYAATNTVAFPGMAMISELESAAKSYSRWHSTCVKSQAAASTACLEKTSPELQTTLNKVNTLAAGLSTMASTNDPCSTVAKVMAAAQAGLTAYTAACSAARATCETSCGSVKNNLDRVKKIISEENDQLVSCNVTIPTNHPSYDQAIKICATDYPKRVSIYISAMKSVTDVDSDIKDAKSIYKKDSACTYEYTNMIASAGAGIMSLANSLQQANKCDDDTSGTSTVDCSLAANATLQKCICENAPRTAGCANSYDKVESSATQVSTGKVDNTSDTNPVVDLDTTGTMGLTQAETSASTGSSGAAPPTGGGGAGLGGGSG
ncbi:MAG: hypothetical protein AAGB31_13425, partial [Bdellovibrio sp.]